MYGALNYKPNEKANAVYVRISDDEKKRGTYYSIANQLSLLNELAVKKGLANLEVYRDENRENGRKTTKSPEKPDFSDKLWRREWDSNPRLLAQHRFSRPAL